MIGLQEIGNFFAREWQSISGAPVLFVTAVAVVGTGVGLFLGFVVWQLRGWTARERIDRLRAQKTAEDDLLELVRAKHELEIEIREEIEAELKSLQGLIERLHSNDSSWNRLIADASAATAQALEKLRQAHDDFVRRMQAWDRERAPHHPPAGHD